MPVIARYGLATLVPCVLLILGASLWGGFAVMALVWLTLVAALADQLLAPPQTTVDPAHSLWATRLSAALAIAHFVVLGLSIDAIASGRLTFWQGIALFFATASFIGQVSHPNAHELIHRKARALRGLGAAVYTSFAFGHHVSAHRLVHHAHVGSEDDPSTPRPGETFYAYLPRAWRGTFEAGLLAEVDRMERAGLDEFHPSNPYWIWVFGAVLAAILSVVIAGAGGAFVFVAFAFFGAVQILMSDYVQHYGLQRLILPNGRREPVAAHHSWNAPRGFSSYLMMNAPAHSEHHLHPGTDYGSLQPGAQGPQLPYPMPIMAVLALAPGAWRRVMDRRALRVMEAAEARSLDARTLATSAKPDRDIRPSLDRPIEPTSTVADAETDALLAKIRDAAS